MDNCDFDTWIPPNKSGQIIATSQDRFPPKGSVLEGKSPAISGKPRLVKYYNLARKNDRVFERFSPKGKGGSNMSSKQYLLKILMLLRIGGC